MEKLGVFDIEKNERPPRIYSFDEKEWVKKEISNGKYLKHAYIPELLESADKLIFLPCLKTHFKSQFTGSLKLSMGCIKPYERLSFHASNIQEKIKLLLKFNHESAGAIIDFNYIEADKNHSVREISKVISRYEREMGKTPTVLVTENGYLKGEVPINHLITSKQNSRAYRLVKKIPHINCNESEERVLSLFKRHPHGKVVVLDDNESVLGLIYTESILHLLDKQASRSLHKFAGINKEEDICDSSLVKVKYRYSWLIINMFTAFLAAAVIGLFESTISRVVILAAYLPIVAGMGGNAATQTLAVTVRGIALNEIDEKNAWTIVKNEAMAGMINGTITGVLAAIVAVLLGQTALLGLVLTMAMIFNLFIAGFFGTIIPLLMKKIGKDPASSATIFITTATDVFGFLAFLGLATLML